MACGVKSDPSHADTDSDSSGRCDVGVVRFDGRNSEPIVGADGQSITVMMPKIARKTLGLRDGSFSRIEIDYHALVFRGPGVTRPVTAPVSMLGTYHSDLLNNLFLYLKNNRQNGILGVTTGPLTKVIFFKQGRIVFAGSTDATERIGIVLKSLDFVTQEQIDEIEAHDDPRRFGVRLKDKGYITYEQLWEALRVQVVSICCSLVSYPVGVYFFLPNCVPGDSFSHFQIEPTQVLFEGVLRMDEKNNTIGYDPSAPDMRSPLEVLSDMERGEG